MPKSVHDPYETLGVTREASEAEIKAAFRQLALRLHPDRNPDDPMAHERFSAVNRAYQILSDSDKRSAYDRMGPSAFERSGAAPRPADFSNLQDILADLFTTLTKSKNSSDNIQHKLVISFVEAARGCERRIEYQRIDHCRVCHGSGGARGAQLKTCASCRGRGKVRYQQGSLPFVLERPCTACRGTGSAPTEPCGACGGSALGPRDCQVTIKIPKGVDSHAVRVVEGAGHRAEPRARPGNLEIIVEVAPDEVFERDGDDVHCQVQVPFITAALGGKLTVPTLDGDEEITIPAATQSGSVFRFRGRGMDSRSRSKKGDQIITLNVHVPTALSPRAKQLVLELQRELNDESQERPGLVSKLKALFE